MSSLMCSINQVTIHSDETPVLGKIMALNTILAGKYIFFQIQKKIFWKNVIIRLFSDLDEIYYD